MAGPFEILFGDIHNHNAYGYGVGSLERSIEIARTHLDFFAFTGHSSWHDMPTMEGGRERHWVKGFARLKDGWPRVQDLIADANRDGDFNAFLGFEWHSSRDGDQCVVFPEDHRPLAFPADAQTLRRFCVDEDALMIPHHLAYPSGLRGVNWSVFDETCTPVVEVFSEHGNSEDDRGPFPFFNHSMGGRQTSNTVRHALGQGLRFGFVASSDSHNGFPGAYGEGLMGVYAADRTRKAIIDGIKARRTYALTGDRINVDFAVNSAAMGETISAGKKVEATYTVEGRDELDVVEVIQDGHVVHRTHPTTQIAAGRSWERPVQLRLEWGWGPWMALALDRITDWEVELQVGGGRIVRYFPCLGSGPFDEARRHRFSQDGDKHLHIRSYTGRKGAHRQNPNHSVVLEIAGDASTRINLSLQQPVERTTEVVLGDLLAGSANLFTGPFPKEAYQFHRLVPALASRVSDAVKLDVPVGRSWVYLRAKQQNGHMAWASPVFLNYA